MNIKEKLLETGLIQNNEYLSQYVQLITDNLFTLKQKGRTQLHHVFPRCLSKILGLKVDPFVINLLYKDHLIAHCLLALASKENIFKHYNMCAVNHIIGVINDDFDFVDLELLQLAYEDSRQQAILNNPMNDADIRKYHDDVMRTEDVRAKISQAMKDYRLENPFSDEHRNKIKQKATGQIFIHKDNELKHVSQDQLDYFLTEGWQIGGLPVPHDIVEKRSKNRCQPIQCINESGEIVAIFDSVKSACVWWADNGYSRKIPKNLYDLANVIKSSSNNDKYICGLKWIYLPKDRPYGKKRVLEEGD